MFIRGGKLHYEMPDHSPAVGHVNCAGRKTNRNPDLADRPPGELAIHAGMQVNKAICRTEPYQSLLARHGYTADNLPTGKIIAVSRIADCCEVTPELAQQGWPGGNEYVFGNYAEEGMPGSWKRLFHWYILYLLRDAWGSGNILCWKRNCEFPDDILKKNCSRLAAGWYNWDIRREIFLYIRIVVL